MALAGLLIALAALVAAGIGCLYCRSAVLIARAGAPNQLLQALEAVQGRVLAAEGNVDAWSAKLVSWRAEMEGVLESVEDALSRVERKRRSIAAADSRLRASEGADMSDHTVLLAKARQQGLMDG